MEDYGFVPLTDAEAAQLGLPSSSATFDVLFDAMNQDLKRNRNYVPNYGQMAESLQQLNLKSATRSANFGSAPDMSEDEKRISFLNRYFVFKKVRNVNLEHMAKRHGHGHDAPPSQSILAKETEVDVAEEPEIVIRVNKPRKLPKQRIKIVSKPETKP
jgi:hypothetical protein